MVPKVGLGKPRRKKCPQDIFCLRSGSALTSPQLDHSFSSPTLWNWKQKSTDFVCTFLFWCPKWDSNPHGFPHDFESCASASSAIRASSMTSTTHHKLVTRYARTSSRSSAIRAYSKRSTTHTVIHFKYINTSFHFCLAPKCIFYWLFGKINVWYIILIL